MIAGWQHGVFRANAPGVTIGNGRFYFAVAEMESDIYVMNLVRR